MMQGWYYVESLTGQWHDSVQTESQSATVDSCFDLIGSLQHGVASCEVCSWLTEIHKPTKCRWWWPQMKLKSNVLLFKLIIVRSLTAWGIRGFRFCRFGQCLVRFLGFRTWKLQFFGFGVGLRVFSNFFFWFPVFINNDGGFSELLSSVFYDFSGFDKEVTPRSNSKGPFI